MAVHTHLDDKEIQLLLEGYDLGSFRTALPVSEGIENTNYVVQLKAPDGKHQEVFLTLFEEIAESDLDYYLAWLAHLGKHALPVAAPLADKQGHTVQHVCNKPAVLFPRLAGKHPDPILPEHCSAMGEALARLHLASQTFTPRHDGPRSHDWLLEACQLLAPKLTPADSGLLIAGLGALESIINEDVPKIAIHGDLFPDNTLFVGHQLSGLVDFVSGGDGLPLFDLAVVTNAWCAKPDGTLDQHRLNALLQAYQQLCPPDPGHTALWPAYLQAAALRFWVSRLLTKLQAADTAKPLVKQKDPSEYRKLLEQHLTSTLPWPITTR